MVFRSEKTINGWLKYGRQISLKMKYKMVAEILGALGIMGKTTPLVFLATQCGQSHPTLLRPMVPLSNGSPADLFSSQNNLDPYFINVARPDVSNIPEVATK